MKHYYSQHVLQTPFFITLNIVGNYQTVCFFLIQHSSTNNFVVKFSQSFLRKVETLSNTLKAIRNGKMCVTKIEF